MPGFTHLQTAQPVTFGHHCLAYVEMFSPRPWPRCVMPLQANERITRSGRRRLPERPFLIDRKMTQPKRWASTGP